MTELSPRMREYSRYNMMRARCHNPNHKAYPNYGGRGIHLCDRWLVGDGNISGFDCYLIDMGPRPEGATIDRIDNDGPYSPENCRWATWEEQHANKRSNHLVTWNGRTQSIASWSRELGIEAFNINNRLKKGWSVEQALTSPVNSYHKRIEQEQRYIR